MSIIASSYKNTSPERIFSFQTVARNENTAFGSLSLWDWMVSSEVVSLEEPSAANTQGNTLQEINFSLSERLASFFPLLRGILASDQPQFFELQADSKLKSFKLIYHAEGEAEAKDYLSKVLGIVKAEARFKQVLRKVIVNQEKFLREEKLLFMELSS